MDTEKLPRSAFFSGTLMASCSRIFKTFDTLSPLISPISGVKWDKWASVSQALNSKRVSHGLKEPFPSHVLGYELGNEPVLVDVSRL
jgi:hypothetical protein